MKTDFDERLCRLDVTEERISELENRSILPKLKNTEEMHMASPGT